MNKNNIDVQAGFSLLEILVAFAIMGLALGILLKIFSGGVNTAILAEDYTISIEIAESLMAKAGTEIALRDHQSSGTENEKYHWSLSISPYSLNMDKNQAETPNAQLFHVNVTVKWGEDESDQRGIELNTLKLAAQPNASLPQ